MIRKYSNSKKAQVTFTLKALTIIASIIAFLMVVWYTQYFFKGTVEEKQEAEFRMQALSTLQKLINEENCLAYSVKDATQKGVIAKEKLDEFEKQYEEIEPECARQVSFDYNIKVRTLPLNISTHQPEGGAGSGIFADVLNIIDGKRVIFITDRTGSMRESGGTHQGKPVTKMECVKIFLKKFIDSMSDESYLSLIPYAAPPCVRPKLFPLTKLAGNRNKLKSKVDTLKANGGTPMCKALKQGFKYGLNSNGEVIVLLTDGCENLCCRSLTTLEVAEQYKDKGIPVYTIGYGQSDAQVCYRPDLTRTAEKTGGKPFRARTCEQLMEKIPEKKVKMKEKRWSFGVGKSEQTGISQFSPKTAREDEVTLSLPVSIRYAPDDYKRAVIYLTAVKGELEKLSSHINRICTEGKKRGEDIKVSLKIHLSNLVKYETNEKQKICMLGPEKTCKVLDCSMDVEFENINEEGDYYLKIEYDSSLNKVKVTK